MKRMHTLSFLMVCFTTIIWLANWGSQESSIEGPEKQSVNFYGTLKTRLSKKPISIDNISIGRKYKQIPMYEKPTIENLEKKEILDKQGKVKKIEYILTADPQTELVTTRIDLSETAEIQIPHPDIVWTYQKENGYRKIEFIEIIVISNNEKKTKAHYLFDLKTKVYCDQINLAGPIEKEVPLQAIDTLTISGYKYRTPAKQTNCPACPVCPTTPEQATTQPAQ